MEADFKTVALSQSGIEDVRLLTFDFDAKLNSRLEEVFGKRTADCMWDGGETIVASAYSSLQAHVDKGRLAYAMKRIQELVRKLEGHRGGIVSQMRAFLAESLGRPAADEAELRATWLALQAELSRLTGLLPSLNEISRVTAGIEAAGASKWAKRLRIHEASADADTVTPANWLDAWNWRQAVMFLDAIDGHHKVRELFEERKALTTALARTYQELVAEKTWLGVFHNSPDSVRQALQAYLNAVQAMGAGTGVRAVRHRKSARDAMMRAYQAVPCWVLPQWRVSETIPPDVGLFDLVVIDEASQSDIWALPALLRGKKVLVVGDHKQVSPSAVGTAEEKIKELVSRFLTNQAVNTCGSATSEGADNPGLGWRRDQRADSKNHPHHYCSNHGIPLSVINKFKQRGACFVAWPARIPRGAPEPQQKTRQICTICRHDKTAAVVPCAG